MTPRRIAAMGAAYGAGLTVLNVGWVVIPGSSNTNWPLTLAFMPLWSAVALTVARSGRHLRTWSVVAAAVICAQYATIETAFGGFQRSSALTSVPLFITAVLAASWSREPQREQAEQAVPQAA